MHLPSIIPAIAAAALLVSTPVVAAPPSRAISLHHLGSYASGVFDAGAAEIVGHDAATQRLFVVNAQAATIDVLSIQDPSAPTLVATIDVTAYGAVANSVAVHQGLVAVAVEDTVKTNPGRVVIFDRELQFVAQVTVGALPDMITFTPNGRYLLVANEGEPNEAYTIDPEGSVSIIELTGPLHQLDQTKVRTADFRAFNSQPIDPNIRVFGPNATAAQDLEPEYIAVSFDSKTAWVTLQENNAIATIDIGSAKVTHLNALGFKDYSLVEAAATTYALIPPRCRRSAPRLAGRRSSWVAFPGCTSKE